MKLSKGDSKRIIHEHVTTRQDVPTNLTAPASNLIFTLAIAVMRI